MLATLPTYLGRSKRLRQPLAILEVQQFGTARAAIRAAEKASLPVVLQCVSDQPLVRALLSLAQASSVPTMLIVRCKSVSDAEHVLSLGIQGVLIRAHDLPENGKKMYLESLAAVLASRDVSLFVEWQATMALPADLAQSGIHGIVLQHLDTVSASMAKELIAHILRSKQLPVFVHAEEGKQEVLKQYLRAGVMGYIVSSAVEESYTAGLRTGLRNHAYSLASEYEHYALLAAEETVSRILINHTSS